MLVITSTLISIIFKQHSGHEKILVFMSTNETNLLEPINYIIMPAIYQHFYEALILTLYVAHHGDMQRVDHKLIITRHTVAPVVFPHTG